MAPVIPEFGTVLGWGGDELAFVLKLVLLGAAACVFAAAWLRWITSLRAQNTTEIESQSAHTVRVAQHDTAVYRPPPQSHATSPVVKHLHRVLPSRTIPAHLQPQTQNTNKPSERTRLVPSKGATFPYYNGHHHDASEHSIPHQEHASSSRILPLQETHDEPQSIPHTHILHGSRATHVLSEFEEQDLAYGQKRKRRDDTTDLAVEGADKRNRPLQAREINIVYARPDDRAREIRNSYRSDVGPSSFDDYETLNEVCEGPGKRWREMAKAEARLRRDAFERSKKAFKAGRKAEAKLLSEEGKHHDAKLKEYNAYAAKEIFASYNPRYGPSYSRCDLHGLHVDEAKAFAESHIVTCKQAGVPKTMLIVGQGYHSQRGNARIKPAILDMLRNTRGIVAGMHEKNEGCIVVEFVGHQ